MCESRIYAGAGRLRLWAVALVTLMALEGRSDGPAATRRRTSGVPTWTPSPADPPYAPRDPNYVEAVAESYRRPPFGPHVGFTLDQVEPGRSLFGLPYRPDLTQQHGFFHGGGVAAGADLEIGAAAGSLAPLGATPATVEFKLNLFAPAVARC